MTVYRIINSGELPSLRMGVRSIRVKREHLEAYLKNQTAVLPPPGDAAEAYADQGAKDREVADFLSSPDHEAFPPAPPAVKPLAAALEARGYGVPAWILAEALEATSAALEEERLQALRESEGDK